MNTVSVSADALRQVLAALTGPGHLIRELQATISISELTGRPNPIKVLINEFNAAVEAPPAGPPVTQHSAFLYEHALNEVLELGYTIRDGSLYPPTEWPKGLPTAPAEPVVQRLPADDTEGGEA